MLSRAASTKQSGSSICPMRALVWCATKEALSKAAQSGSASASWRVIISVASSARYSGKGSGFGD
eukprot:scaffold47137_cov64-Phaeocystis_antarctica.AAC.3